MTQKSKTSNSDISAQERTPNVKRKGLPRTKLKIGEANYRSFIENLPVLFYVVDSKSPYSPLYVSPGFARFGYPLEDWITYPDMWSRVLHPDDRDRIFALTDQSAVTGEDVDYEFRIISATGDIHWVHDRGCLIRDAEGKMMFREGVMLDVTSRVRADEELKHSEERYRNLFENANDVIYVHDLTGRYLSLNKAAERVFGYSREEAMDLDMTKVVLPEYLELVRQKLQAKIEGVAEQTAYEIDCYKKDGSIVRLEVNSSIIRKSGVPVAVQGIARDITERKLAENRLRESEEFNRSIINSSLDCIKTLSLDGTLLSMSEKGQEMLCIPDINEFIGTDWLLFWHGEDRIAAQAAVDAAASGGTGRFVGFFRILDGTDKWWDVQVSPIVDSDGKPAKLLAVSRDITERRIVEQQLRESETKFRTVTESASDAIITIDDQGVISFVNAAATEIFGYEQEEMLGQNLTMLMPERHREGHEKGLARYLNTGQRKMPWKAMELPGLHKLGHEVAMELSFAEFVTNDKRYFTSVIRDISERKQARAQLEKSEANLAAAQRITHLGSWELIVNNVNNADENVIEWSDEVYRIFGFEPKSFTPTSAWVYENVHDDDRETVSEAFTAAVINGTFLDLECRISLPDGSERLVRTQAETEYDESGKPLRMVGTVQDITERHLAEEALRTSEQQYRDLFENANDLIYTHDLNGNFMSLNRAGEQITGYTRDEAIGMNIIQVVAPESVKIAQEMAAKKLVDHQATTYELFIISKDGRRVLLELSTRLILKNGVPVGIQGIGRDITERRQAEEQLKESERRYRQLGEGIFHQVWTAEPDGKLDYVNQRTLDYFGRREEEMLADGWHDVVHPDDIEESVRRWNYSTENGCYFECQYRLQRHDGVYRWHIARANPGFDADGKIVKWYGTTTDIEDQKQSEALLNHIARHDSLTDLPNRTEFMAHLRSAVDRAKANPATRFAVLFLDLDRFKVINDSLGHMVGDKLLKAIAERLNKLVRPGDVVARLGGDEFTILLNRSGEPEDVIYIADRVQRNLAKAFKIDGYEVYTSASIGIIVSDEIMREPEDFLRDADSAMYRAKEAGKARYEIFDREMHVRNMNLLQIETDLRHAVDRGEFEVHYQPIVDLITGRINEFEALVRWRHPKLGLVPPDQFIGVAEETGMIVPIGQWVLTETCRQIADWQKRVGRHVSVSVNLSARELMNPALITLVQNILRSKGLKPSNLKIEVTESTVMEHSERSLSVLKRLSAMGIVLSTDDFGTGYSSLSYLAEFPFKRLKIDRSFINKMGSDANSGAIVRAILLLASNLGLEVVAEGIETEGQLVELKAQGCNLGQGYLFSRPVEAEHATKLLESERARSGDASGEGQNSLPLLEVPNVQ
ncbi:MAG: PAS domain S-box protein [Pyrinomonadaceae bacterium]|nr:PAS domain S-box protein [Pyrinomonadaceae bacterium]